MVRHWKFYLVNITIFKFDSVIENAHLFNYVSQSFLMLIELQK